MASRSPIVQTPLGTIPVDDREVRVTLHTSHDGVEYVGRLFFAESGWENNGIPDRSVLPGRTTDDVLRRARDLQLEELAQRYRRANAEKRKYHGLRQLTMELLAKVRYQNRVAVGMRTGLLDPAAGQHELDLTENEMMTLIRQMKFQAGIES
ncbi:MAG TPA: hypothetical protein DGD08_15510 [Gemmatimonas aurantiaca]|uniref:Uncharacterized protein n=2 Tax=Gemmatimonas aurantiaca TaxID=173480 RepID=C1A5R9_GEMAT|nr:hypothetical protein [Gemmatimonas aurantiaca]BAH37579.1 hypothetical protein GAU_0537 [Gemmatimonas aurantiaca T-27]HCT58611.1 hypothetical protein [Gemmatimonas aurantiaca]